MCGHKSNNNNNLPFTGPIMVLKKKTIFTKIDIAFCIPCRQ